MMEGAVGNDSGNNEGCVEGGGGGVWTKQYKCRTDVRGFIYI